MISIVKLPVLNKGEYTLWSMRMELLPPKTAQALLQRQKERKAKSIMLLAIPNEYQLRFHTIKDAKSLWAAIKSRFGGNVESNEDAEDGINEIDINDLYNNLKVFEADIKGSYGSSSNSQNVAFLSAEDTKSINEVNIANGVSTAADHSSQGQASSSSYTSDLMFSFLADQRGHFARECRAPRNQGNRNGDAGYRSRDNTRRTIPVETSDALVVQDNALIVQDGLGYDWSYIAQDEPTEFALMAYTANSSSRSSDGDDNQTNDRFKKDNGYYAVPPHLTGNYMPPLADLSFARLDDSVYRPIVNKISASVPQVETNITSPSNASVEMPRVESVRPSGVIIEDWVSDDEDIFQSNDLQATYKPSFKRIEFTNARNESVKSKQAEKPRIITQNPTVDRRDWNEKMTQKLGLGFGFTKKACFVCGSYIIVW
ncbi:hypothetical protein Tco_1427648 [Tanacetum coccineum]